MTGPMSVFGCSGSPIFKRGDCFDQPRDQSFVDITHRDQPRQCGAFLALKIEGRLENAQNGFIEIRIRIDNHRVFAAHFADDFFQVPLIARRDGRLFAR